MHMPVKDEEHRVAGAKSEFCLRRHGKQTIKVFKQVSVCPAVERKVAGIPAWRLLQLRGEMIRA